MNAEVLEGAQEASFEGFPEPQLGGDTPVERINPIPNYYATVTRKLKDGTTFYPDQRMSREEALKSYTWNAAYAAKEEAIKGSITAGKLADFVMLEKDPHDVDPNTIKDIKVLRTVTGGRTVYPKSEG